MNLNRHTFRLLLGLAALVCGVGCGGLAASPSISPALFLLEKTKETDTGLNRLAPASEPVKEPVLAWSR